MDKGASATLKVQRIFRFLGEQEEREAVVAWLRAVGDRKPHGTDWRTYYEIADAIDIGRHRDSDGSPKGRAAAHLDGEAARARAEGIAQAGEREGGER